MTQGFEQRAFRRRDYVLALVFSAIERGGQTVLLFVSSIYIARVIGPAAFGVASLAMSLALLLELACGRLFRDVIVQRRALSDREIGAAISGTLVASIALAAALAVLAPWLARLFAMPDLARYLPLAALSIVFTGSGGVFAAILHRRLEFKHLAHRTLAGAFLGTAVGIGLAAGGFGGISLVAQYVVQSGTALVALLVTTRGMPRPNLDWRSLAPLLRYALPSAAAEGISNGAFRLFAALAGYLSGAVVVGHLEIAMRFVQAARNLWASIVGPVALSLFAANQHDRPGLHAVYRRLSAMNCLAALPVFAGLVVIAPDFVALALGEQWLPAAPAMQFLAAAAAGAILRLFVPTVLNAIGRPALNLPSAIAGVLAALAALALLGPVSAAWAAAAWCTRALVSQPITNWAGRRGAGLELWRDLWRPTLPALAASLLMAGATMALDAWLWSGWPAAAQLAANVACGAALYALCIALFARPVLRDLWQLGADFLARR